MGLETLLQAWAARTEAALGQWLANGATATPDRLLQAMRYTVLDGGKRIRPALVYATGTLLGTAPERLDGPACAIEFIHAYSLVHDDLPAMDDDDLRRGKPTCHKAFDEATAILVGDALQTLAFQVLAEDSAMALEPAQRIAMIGELARAGGAAGMVGGQALDMAATGRQQTLVQLERMHSLKTGALIRASVRLGALTHPGLAAEQREALDTYAEAIGLAFQIRDDILDQESSTAVLGKRQGADLERDKATYTRLLGLQGARVKLQETRHHAIAALAPFGTTAQTLRELADFIVERVK